MTTTKHETETVTVQVTLRHAYDGYVLFTGTVSAVSDRQAFTAAEKLIDREAAKFDSDVDWDAEARLMTT